MSTANGSTNGTHSASSTDADLDVLYAWMPGLTPAPQPCPEACFSLTLKGTLGGVDAMITVRGMTSAEFQQNLHAVRGLLDPTTPAPPARTGQGQGQGWCLVHNVAMKQTTKDGRSWYSHKKDDGTWCKGRTR